MSRLKLSIIASLLSVFLLAISLQSCVVHTKTTPSASKTHVPPGQAKKATGSQSAKQYAPGQQKKKK